MEQPINLPPVLPTSFTIDGKPITLSQARLLSLNMHALMRKELAEILGNSVSTINTHFNTIHKILGVDSSSKARLWARKNDFDDKGCYNGLYLFEGKEGNYPWL